MMEPRLDDSLDHGHEGILTPRDGLVAESLPDAVEPGQPPAQAPEQPAVEDFGAAVEPARPDVPGEPGLEPEQSLAPQQALEPWAPPAPQTPAGTGELPGVVEPGAMSAMRGEDTTGGGWADQPRLPEAAEGAPWAERAIGSEPPFVADEPVDAERAGDQGEEEPHAIDGAGPEVGPDDEGSVPVSPWAAGAAVVPAGTGELAEASQPGQGTGPGSPVEPVPAAAIVAPGPVPVRRTVSQQIARRLHAAGARFCFTVPGESFLPLIDDLVATGIRVVTTRHEGGAAFMAEALAQSTGRPQIVLVTRSVGATNAAIGIHTAQQDSAPLIALVGQVQRHVSGREAFQECDLIRSVGSLATWAGQLDDPLQVDHLLDQAWSRVSRGRPGPLLLALPEDVLSEEIETLDHGRDREPGARGAAADRADVRRVLKMLAASERGVILAGGGVLRSHASKRLVALSEALAVPVVAAWRRPDVVPNDHPNYLGMTGYWSPSTVRARLEDADVMLVIGARLSETTTFGYAVPAAATRWVHVDLEPRPVRGGPPAPDIAVAADASRFLDAAWSDLRGAALDNEMRSRREARMAADRDAYRAAAAVGQGTWQGPGVHPGRLIDTLRAVLPDNAVLATDAGNLAGWLARGYAFRRPGTFLGPTSGAMGFGVPAAVAASLRDPDRISVAVCGDGGFAMTMAEIETAVREGARPILIVLDNQRYGTTAMHQARAGRPTRSSELGPVDFAAVARALGALGVSVTDDAGFEPALRDAIAARRTAVLHVALDPAWVSVDDNPVSAG